MSLYQQSIEQDHTPSQWKEIEVINK